MGAVAPSTEPPHLNFALQLLPHHLGSPWYLPLLTQVSSRKPAPISFFSSQLPLLSLLAFQPPNDVKHLLYVYI